MTTDSYIHYGKGSTSFVGPDATHYFAALTLYHAIRLYAKHGIRPTRMVGPKQMLAMASRYTGKTYKRSELAKAADDVETWARTMRAALPETVDPDSPSSGERAAEPQKGGQ
jgi:hypothetical protein